MIALQNLRELYESSSNFLQAELEPLVPTKNWKRGVKLNELDNLEAIQTPEFGYQLRTLTNLTV